MDNPQTDSDGRAPSLVRGFNREFGAGVFLLAIAALAYYAAANLRMTLPSGIGPGTMPKASAALIALFGIALVIQGLTTAGEWLEAWPLRGPLFLLGAIVVFGATVRTLGLAVAGPAAVIIASLADRQTRLVEIVPFALLLSAACIGLFKYALRQPIPLAPFWLGY